MSQSKTYPISKTLSPSKQNTTSVHNGLALKNLLANSVDPDQMVYILIVYGIGPNIEVPGITGLSSSNAFEPAHDKTYKKT